MYKVVSVEGGRTRVLHRNLLLPLQGRIRQPGGQEVEDLPSPEEEEDEDSGILGVPRAPQVRARRRHVSSQSKPTQHIVASDQDASADLKSKDSSDFRQLYDSLHIEESSDEGELYRVEDSNTISQTESQFSSNMPYLEDSNPSETSPSSNHIVLMKVFL